MKWNSTKYVLPGSEYVTGQDFIVVYHHGDNVVMTNMARWNGRNFIIGTTCFCDECTCDCSYHVEYSKECHVTHWAFIDLPEQGMESYC